MQRTLKILVGINIFGKKILENPLLFLKRNTYIKPLYELHPFFKNRY